ncbi:DUF3833 domain-containing protein [Aliarcobacter skirrowii]|uniref:DUF3833 domain-containing protein n=1 Tax=Aliarcobacter skirrowii TaxID=28200 RepID=A0A2U2C0H9_9BACT|nr:DUF3833 domain-containing protein [Aliarcobacter skirrowii]MDX4063736.1 DUF3833 domain-containing protein [Aliarcobacter skirrowii]PWE21529.1 DUF3833 domain-containing protein [Aliarcobacter skirrowii]
MKNLLLVFITTILLTGCASMKIEDFNNTKPEFIPQEYFNGKLRAYGIVKDRSGKIIRSFKGEMIGSWDKNGIGTLDEFFVYDDGEEMKRVWTLKPIENKKFIATADDIVGESPMIANGNTVMIDYVMRTPYKSSTIDLSVQDWLHLQDNGVIINHSKMKKFGFVVGELVITIIKE